jgi:creatinine amidohydrolase/Fe(II)-dependent formamide hydrolase-like protein
MLPEANPYRYVFMRPSKVQRVVAECPIAIQPTGLLEWHGDQNPLGLDGMLAHYIGERAIIKLGGGALFPPNFVGTYGYARFPGTMCFDQATVTSVFTQMFREILKFGFKVVLLMTGHWGSFQEECLSTAVETVEQEIRDKGIAAKIFGMKWSTFLLGMGYGGHGQEGETAMVWRMSQHYGLDLVDLSNFQVGEEHVEQYPLDDQSIPVREPDPWPWEKDLRDPAICSPEIGEQMIDIISSGIVEHLTEELQDLGIEYEPTK